MRETPSGADTQETFEGATPCGSLHFGAEVEFLSEAENEIQTMLDGIFGLNDSGDGETVDGTAIDGRANGPAWGVIEGIANDGIAAGAPLGSRVVEEVSSTFELADRKDVQVRSASVCPPDCALSLPRGPVVGEEP